MANLTITVPDADLAAVDAVWMANGYAGGLAARLKEFADVEVKAALVSAAQVALAVETAKGGGADPATVKDLLYAEYQARVS